MQLTPDEAERARGEIERVRDEIERVIVGKRAAIELVLTAFLARGHVLIEDIPGVGKTLLARAMARATGGDFGRIQFTPDLLPGDITGMHLPSVGGEWQWMPGPVFSHFVLADEINRATPRTQSALLEAMEEAQVTLDGRTRALPQPFFVLATQNPLEYRGTFALPEAQLDRFLLRLHLGYPQANEEADLLERHRQSEARGEREEADAPDEMPATSTSAVLENVRAVLGPEEARALQNRRAQVWVSPAIRDYIVAIATATRSHPPVALGASPRASLALQRAAQAAALLNGRPFVTPDDIKHLAPSVLSHRLLLHRVGDRAAAESVVAEVLERVAAP